MNYDIIGDIHGQADKLEALLRKLGYVESGGCWRQSGRQVIFVGDFVDRGPGQLRSVDTARRMVEGGAALAIMGNHELNAIAWHTPNPAAPGEYLRPHGGEWGPGNRKQHAALLAEVEGKPDLHAEIVRWFLTLPLWLELPGLRVVHGCWHPTFMAFLAPLLGEGRLLKRELLPAATLEPEDLAEKDNATPTLFKAVEALTKGIEIPLPGGHTFIDKDGITRERVRVRWWDATATTYRTAAMLPPETQSLLPDEPIPAHARIASPAAAPVFFGHYWLTGAPALQASNAACVDYSAGKGGPLVAYRWEGEQVLDAGRFVSAE